MELAACTWPITNTEEVDALLSAPHASPKAVMAFEFTGAVRKSYCQNWYYTRVAISVDIQSSFMPGPLERL